MKIKEAIEDLKIIKNGKNISRTFSGVFVDKYKPDQGTT